MLSDDALYPIVASVAQSGNLEAFLSAGDANMMAYVQDLTATLAFKEITSAYGLPDSDYGMGLTVKNIQADWEARFQEMLRGTPLFDERVDELIYRGLADDLYYYGLSNIHEVSGEHVGLLIGGNIKDLPFGYEEELASMINERKSEDEIREMSSRYGLYTEEVAYIIEDVVRVLSPIDIREVYAKNNITRKIEQAAINSVLPKHFGRVDSYETIASLLPMADIRNLPSLLKTQMWPLQRHMDKPAWVDVLDSRTDSVIAAIDGGYARDESSPSMNTTGSMAGGGASAGEKAVQRNIGKKQQEVMWRNPSEKARFMRDIGVNIAVPV